jgi:hypothetical protein
MRTDFAFVEAVAIFVGSTRVSRVQFGVPPNCHGARGFAFCRPHSCSMYTASVSGVTPETTRQRRVLPTAFGRAH